MPKKSQNRLSSNKLSLLVFVLLFAVVGLVALSLTSAAGRGGGNKAGASISFSPSPAIVGSDYLVSGSGFRSNVWVTVSAVYDVPYWASAITDGNGNFVVSHHARSAGSIQHQAKEQRNNGSLVLKASGILIVNTQ